MKNKAQLIAAITAGISLLTVASAQTTLYLNRAQAVTNNAISTNSSWYTDAAGTTAFTGTVSSTSNILAFNNLVTTSYTGRTGGGGSGTMSIYGFQVLDPAGAITVTTASNANQTVTIAGAVGIDMSTATQDFTYKAGSDTIATNPGTLRIGSGAPATSSWKVNTGRTLTIGSTTWNTNNAPNTSVISQSTGKTLALTGNGTTAMGTIVFNANVGSNSLAITIDGTGTSTSGGNVAFNGLTNSLGSLSITNAKATFASGGTTSGTITVNSTGTLAGTGTLSGAATINGILRPNTAPVNNTSRLTFGNTFTLGGTSSTTFDIDGANFTGVTVSTTDALTFGGSLAFNFVNSITPGTYDLFNFTDSNTGSFSSVAVASVGALSVNSGVWTGTYGGNSYSFSEFTGDLTISAVPEPSTWAAIVGLAGLGFAASRRRRKA